MTGTKLPVLPVPPGHPVSKQNADAFSVTRSVGQHLQGPSVILLLVRLGAMVFGGGGILVTKLG